MFSYILPWYLRKTYNVTEFEFVNVERLRESLRAGHGVLLMPNHCRDEDGLMLGMLSIKVKQWFYYMSSWHVFKMNRTNAFLLPRLGLFSVYREGPDRGSVKMSVDILAHAERPLVIFPEGYLARTNDRLGELMDGAALTARAAARKRAQIAPSGKVVIHPVALRYHFLGDIDVAVAEVLDQIEARLNSPPSRDLPSRERILKVGEALLTLKEIEYLGRAQTGSLASRLSHLIQSILVPLEVECLGQQHNDTVQSRVRRLRIAIVPGLLKAGITKAERERCWRHLAGVYLAQQLDNYPPDYLSNNPTPERLLETIERFEEDVTDKVTPHGPLRVTISVGEAIEVSPAREGRAHDDQILRGVERQLREMLGLAPEVAQQAAVPKRSA
jgi:1-acyl-sn-glycerol-3-phosphate acyltransferase